MKLYIQVLGLLLLLVGLAVIGFTLPMFLEYFEEEVQRKYWFDLDWENWKTWNSSWKFYVNDTLWSP